MVGPGIGYDVSVWRMRRLHNYKIMLLIRSLANDEPLFCGSEKYLLDGRL